MDDAELRGLLEQIQERVDRAMEMTEEVGKQIAEHRLTVAGVVGDLKLNLAVLSTNVTALVSAVSTSVEHNAGAAEAVTRLANELEKKRSHEEWQAALDKAAEPKRILGRTPQQLGGIALILALLIIAGLVGVEIPNLLSLFAGGTP